MGTTDLLGRYDGLLCVEVLECVAPERWPGVAAGLAGAMRAGAPAYVTVELRSGPLPAASDPRQMPGEVIEGGGYHYYPSRPQVRRWLDQAGFAVAGQTEDGRLLAPPVDTHLKQVTEPSTPQPGHLRRA
jgi:hypothetical protein